MVAKSIGQCLQKCTALEDITLSSGEDSAPKQVIKFHDSHLNLESISEEFVSMLLAISPTCFKKVRSFQIETIVNKQCISSFINHNVNSNGLLQLSALSEANIHKHK